VGLLDEPLTMRLVIATPAMLAGIALVLTQQAQDSVPDLELGATCPCMLGET
jgi:hypothetical protein